MQATTSTSTTGKKTPKQDLYDYVREITEDLKEATRAVQAAEDANTLAQGELTNATTNETHKSNVAQTYETVYNAVLALESLVSEAADAVEGACHIVDHAKQHSQAMVEQISKLDDDLKTLVTEANDANNAVQAAVNSTDPLINPLSILDVTQVYTSGAYAESTATQNKADAARQEAVQALADISDADSRVNLGESMLKNLLDGAAIPGDSIPENAGQGKSPGTIKVVVDGVSAADSIKGITTALKTAMDAANKDLAAAKADVETKTTAASQAAAASEAATTKMNWLTATVNEVGTLVGKLKANK